MSKNLKRNKFLKQNKNMPGDASSLQAMRKRILWQAGLTTLVLVLTIVIVFAITAAWTTNIVQTSGLQFQAETWGFDRSISVAVDAVSASPGDEGPVKLVVQNDNPDTADVSVNVSKDEMDPNMQQRLYFYVDTQATRNGETMDRVYLNKQDSYTYVLLSGEELSLTEDSHNDAQLKWQWVYDVLGYYVWGVKTGTGEVSEIEYLRPIEYIYDPMQVEFEKDENGIPSKLKRIGDQSVAEFLAELSAHDGYKGQIDVNAQLSGGYYPVEVEESGYGVYAYLCSYGEIEAATEFDTKLGMDAAAGTVSKYEAVLTISAQNHQTIVADVETLAAMNAAIAEGTANVMQLSDDMVIASGEQLIIPAGREISLDLNGHTLTSQTSDTLMEVKQGAALTVFNGSIKSETGSTKAIHAVGAEVTLREVNISGFKQGVSVVDSEGNQGLDSMVRLLNCTLDTTGTSVLILGNGTLSGAKTQVVIEDCTINSDGIAISGNGSVDGVGNWGTDIQIINTKVTSNHTYLGAGIYHPQKDSTLTIYNSEISGYTGMAIKGGTVNVVKSVIEGRGAEQPASFLDSGFADTGDGIYIETNYGYPILLEISEGSTIKSNYGKSLQVYESTAAHVDVNIISGSFKEEQPEDYIAPVSVQNGNVVTVAG